jgi:transposase-like protein
MKKSRFTEEQIAYALRLAEGGTPVADVCRQIGISDATFYTWKKKYADMGVSELRKLKLSRATESSPSWQFKFPHPVENCRRVSGPSRP